MWYYLSLHVLNRFQVLLSKTGGSIWDNLGDYFPWRKPEQPHTNILFMLCKHNQDNIYNGYTFVYMYIIKCEKMYVPGTHRCTIIIQLSWADAPPSLLKTSFQVSKHHSVSTQQSMNNGLFKFIILFGQKPTSNLVKLDQQKKTVN